MGGCSTISPRPPLRTLCNRKGKRSEEFSIINITCNSFSVGGNSGSFLFSPELASCSSSSHPTCALPVEPFKCGAFFNYTKTSTRWCSSCYFQFSFRGCLSIRHVPDHVVRAKLCGRSAQNVRPWLRVECLIGQKAFRPSLTDFFVVFFKLFNFIFRPTETRNHKTNEIS